MYEFCVVVFNPSYLGLALSLRDVEFSSGSRCPEVPLNSFALTFSVSRGRFGIFASVRFVSFFLLLNSDRALGLRMDARARSTRQQPATHPDRHGGGERRERLTSSQSMGGESRVRACAD